MKNTYKNRARIFRRALLACSARRAEMGRELVQLRHELAKKELLISVLLRERAPGVTYGHA